MADHKDLTAASTHVIGYQQATDPGAIGAGKAWLDTSMSVFKIRNAANTDWTIPDPYIYLDGAIVQFDEDLVNA